MLGVVLAGFLALAGCGSDATENTSKDAGGSSEKDQVVVGITQYAPHTSLDAATEGFKKALEDEGFKEGENLKFDFQMRKVSKVTQQQLHKTLLVAKWT